MSVNETNYWDQLANETAQFGSGEGGAGIIGKVRIETGWNVGGPGVSQEESWFPAPHTDKGAVAVGKKAAKALANSVGGRFYYGIGIVMPRDQCFSRGEEAAWSIPVMVRFTANFFDSYKQVLLPSLEKNDIHIPWEGWARIRQCADPSGRLDKNGKPRQAY